MKKTIAAALATVMLGVVPAPAAAARADESEIVSIELAQTQIDVSDGWALATVSLHLRNPDGLPDTITAFSNEPLDVVLAKRADAVGGERGPMARWLGWDRLDRVSGTPTDGVWSHTVELSPAFQGDYTIYGAHVDYDSFQEITDGPVLRVTGGETWALTNAPEPIRVVTGQERWRPRARVTNTVTGRPVGGARVHQASIYDDAVALTRRTTSPGPAADANGVWTSPVTFRVTDLLESRFFVYGGRGNRGWSLQGLGCVDPSVKLQASSAYSDTTLVGAQPLTVTGNVWPAPSILQVDASVLLQRFGPLGWQTVATAQPRDNGRYTITWNPAGPGTHQLRVRLPGNGNPQCANGTAGTSLATTTVTAS